MIASVRGTVTAVGPVTAVIEMGGFGVAVSCSPGTLARLRVGAQGRLATSLVVREDSLTLFGFADDDERALFELLQTANGVGPRLAQTILATLVQVPGIGRKSAERIVLELRDRIGAIDGSDVAATTVVAGGAVTATSPWRDQVTHALAGLGFTGKEAAAALDTVAADLPGDADPDVSAVLRRSIQLLGRAT